MQTSIEGSLHATSANTRRERPSTLAMEGRPGSARTRVADPFPASSQQRVSPRAAIRSVTSAVEPGLESGWFQASSRPVSLASELDERRGWTPRKGNSGLFALVSAGLVAGVVAVTLLWVGPAAQKMPAPAAAVERTPALVEPAAPPAPVEPAPFAPASVRAADLPPESPAAAPAPADMPKVEPPKPIAAPPLKALAPVRAAPPALAYVPPTAAVREPEPTPEPATTSPEPTPPTPVTTPAEPTPADKVQVER